MLIQYHYRHVHDDVASTTYLTRIDTAEVKTGADHAIGQRKLGAQPVLASTRAHRHDGYRRLFQWPLTVF